MSISSGSLAILVLMKGRDCGRVVALRSPYLPSLNEARRRMVEEEGEATT